MRNSKQTLTVCALALLLALPLAAFASDKGKKKKKSAEKVAAETPTVREQPPSPPPARPANGALFTDDAPQAGLFGDFKARRIGDLIFIDVVEASNARVESGAQRKRDSGAAGGVGTLAGALPLPGAAVAGAVIGALGTRKFEGKGSTERNSNLEARIVARVVEVLPNGDLRVEASKIVKINKEDETLALSGVVRPSDVAADNSVPTTQVGDLRVQLSGKGVASADNAPGWLFRLFEKITPF